MLFNQFSPEAKFGVGPAIDTGFYYDVDINTNLTDEILLKIEKKMIEIAEKDNSYSEKNYPKTML